MEALVTTKFAIITGTAQWQRCGFQDAALVEDCVQLGWEDTSAAGKTLGTVDDTAGAGLAFDRYCRLYHSQPGTQSIERILWGAFDPLHPKRALNAIDIISLQTPPTSGDFSPSKAPPPGFTPRSLAGDDQDHLYILDSADDRIIIFDLLQQRLVRSCAVPTGAADIAWHQGWLYGISREPACLWRLSATRSLRMIEMDLSALDAPARLSFADDGRLFVIDQTHQTTAQLLELGGPGDWLTAASAVVLGDADNPIAFASDLEHLPSEEKSLVVVARRPNEDFVVIDIDHQPYRIEKPLTAKSYDGMGIIATPDGRIAYWTEKGLRHAVAGRLRYRPQARVIGYRLDSQRYLNTWGRVLIDACVPAGTAIRLHAITSDEEDIGEHLSRTAPVNSSLATIVAEEETPLPLTALMPADDDPGLALYRRQQGSEQPWLIGQDDYITLEAPVHAPAARYLWLIFTLTGSARSTPKIRSVRAEYPGHDWLQRLPRLYSRDEAMRDFLQRYLAPMAGLSDELAENSETRHALLKPQSTPAVALPWLAHWVGLTLDERWSETAKRTFVREAVSLFRLRGTIWSLKRMLEIVTGVPVIIIEKFRLRGLGRVGADGQGWDNPAILGGGMRIGGPVGVAQATGSDEAIEDSFAEHAHRFTVMLLMELNDEMLDVVKHLLEVQRPAHTLAEVCGVGAGMRIGRGLHVELTSIIGRSGGFKQIQLGASTLGRDRIIGKPSGAIKPEASRLGQDTRLR